MKITRAEHRDLALAVGLAIRDETTLEGRPLTRREVVSVVSDAIGLFMDPSDADCEAEAADRRYDVQVEDAL